jgi:hypothetical protein
VIEKEGEREIFFEASPTDIPICPIDEVSGVIGGQSGETPIGFT